MHNYANIFAESLFVCLYLRILAYLQREVPLFGTHANKQGFQGMDTNTNFAGIFKKLCISEGLNMQKNEEIKIRGILNEHLLDVDWYLIFSPNN